MVNKNGPFVVLLQLKDLYYYFGDKCQPPVNQWTENLILLSIFEHIAYSQLLHMDVFLDIWDLL